MTLGQKGCLNADLVIAQAQSVQVTVVHEDGEGHVSDHSSDTGYCRLQRAGYDDVVLDEYVACTDEAVTLTIPGSVTAEIEPGTWVWDIFVGEIRLVYGKARVYDTYARDDVNG